MPNKKQFVKCIHPLRMRRSECRESGKDRDSNRERRRFFSTGLMLYWLFPTCNWMPQNMSLKHQVYGTKVKLHEAYLCGQQATENTNPNSISNSFSLNRKNSAQTTDALSYCYSISFERKFALISSWALDGDQKWKNMLVEEREKETTQILWTIHRI